MSWNKPLQSDLTMPLTQNMDRKDLWSLLSKVSLWAKTPINFISRYMNETKSFWPSSSFSGFKALLKEAKCTLNVCIYKSPWSVNRPVYVRFSSKVNYNMFRNISVQIQWSFILFLLNTFACNYNTHTNNKNAKYLIPIKSIMKKEI